MRHITDLLCAAVPNEKSPTSGDQQQYHPWTDGDQEISFAITDDDCASLVSSLLICKYDFPATV